MFSLYLITVLCIGPFIGVEFAVSAFVNPILWTPSGAAIPVAGGCVHPVGGGDHDDYRFSGAPQQQVGSDRHESSHI